jgi:hypothetical protein
VIAIENTRLFEAEQASKRELRESLEYQTAISDVLDVISRSPSRDRAPAMQELAAELLFELLDLPTERRLGDVKLFRRSAEAARRS